MKGDKILRSIRLLGVLTVILFVAVAALAGWNYKGAQHAKSLASCLSKWADDSTSRSAVLTRLANERTNALDDLIRAVPSARTNPEHFHLDVVLYIIASDAYKKALMSHPIPAPPKVRC
jgi:hypothetical protein